MMSTFVFVKGTSQHIADTLSRAHLDSTESNKDDRARIMNIYAFAEIPDKRLDEIREATFRDTSLQTISKLVLDDGLKKSTIFPLKPYLILTCVTLSV